MVSTLELPALAERAGQGDREAAETLRAVLDANPQVWQTIGDLARHAEMTLIAAIATGNLLVSNSLEREIRRRKQELTGPDASPLEHMAIERVVATWLQLQYLDSQGASIDASHPSQAAWCRRQESAEKRYAQAVKSLMLIRQMERAHRAKSPVATVAKPRQTRLSASKSTSPPPTNGHANAAPPCLAANGDTPRKLLPPRPLIPNNRIEKLLHPQAGNGEAVVAGSM